jgi:hypothetical protein
MIRTVSVVTAVLAALVLSGCGALQVEHVKPWQHDALAMPGMQIDPEPMISACDDHIYFSREASKGGHSYGGGGCGCN